MGTEVHVIDVNQGNMVLVDTATGEVLLCDCNVSYQNEDRVLAYLKQVLGRRRIYAFISTHRDADHMRGINRVHRAVGIDRVWDSGLPGGTVGSPDYDEYMRMRRAVPTGLIRPLTYVDFGATRIRFLSAASGYVPDDCNAQSVVLKVEHGVPRNSILLTGDSDVSTWKAICASHLHMMSLLASEILLASHHGSWTFFDCGEDGYHYPGHVRAINPAMTVVSVGRNGHGHPDPTAIAQYEAYSRGSFEGHKLWRTDRDGTMRLDLTDSGYWILRRWEGAHLGFDLPDIDNAALLRRLLPPPSRFPSVLGDALRDDLPPSVPSISPALMAALFPWGGR